MTDRTVREAIAAAGAMMPNADHNGYALPITQQPVQVANAMWSDAVRGHVGRLAPAVAGELLDSPAFIDTLDPLVDLDPRSPEFAAGLESAVTSYTTSSEGY